MIFFLSKFSFLCVIVCTFKLFCFKFICIQQVKEMKWNAQTHTHSGTHSYEVMPIRFQWIKPILHPTKNHTFVKAKRWKRMTTYDDHIQTHAHSSDSIRAHRNFLSPTNERNETKILKLERKRRKSKKKTANVCIIIVDSKKLWLFIFGYWFWQKENNKKIKTI